MESQNKQILNYLKQGKCLTPIEALEKFGSFRLAARIYELRNQGWPIVKDRIEVGGGRYVASYSIDQSLSAPSK